MPVTPEPRAWWGRVFARGDQGGNSTVIVPGAEPTAELAAIARRLAVPDTGFVVGQDEGAVRLRTFSPVEELTQCIQTSLAAVTALDLASARTTRVEHPTGEPLLVHLEGSISWATAAEPQVLTLEEIDPPAAVPVDLEPGQPAVVVRQARSRLHLRCASVDQVESVELAAGAVREVCRRTGTSGLVLSAGAPTRQRVRVFTTSLAGAEDTATGGAVLALGGLLAADGVRGEIEVRQGPADPARQGHLRLRVHGATAVSVGGEVATSMRGELWR